MAEFIAEVPKNGDYTICNNKLYIVAPDRKPKVIDLISGTSIELSVDVISPKLETENKSD